MGNWCGFTPFIGAGIGFATLTVDGMKDVNDSDEGVGFGDDHTKTNFAYAFYAGGSFDITPQVALRSHLPLRGPRLCAKRSCDGL